jgi:hypothetical protein
LLEFVHITVPTKRFLVNGGYLRSPEWWARIGGLILNRELPE